MMLRALMADMSLVSFDGRVASLRCAPSVRSIAEKKLDDLGRLISKLCGASVRAELVDSPADGPVSEHSPSEGGEPTGSGEGGSGSPQREPTLPPDTDHPVVIKTLEMFNGRIVEVKPIRTKPLDE